MKPRWYQDNYLVFPDGRVWSHNRKKGFLRQFVAGGGYLYVDIKGKKIAVHRLLLIVFKRPPRFNREQGRHIDDNKFHNHISNLKWGSARDNKQDSIRNGTHAHGSNHGNSKLNEKHLRILRKRFVAGETDIHKRYARKHGMSPKTVRRAIRGGKGWKHVT